VRPSATAMRAVIAAILGSQLLSAQAPTAPAADPPSQPSSETPSAAEQPAEQPAETPSPAAAPDRTALNLLGQEDTKSGEGRRNENVQFNLVDTNALQELNVRLGVTATIVQTFAPDRDYYGSEYGKRPPPPLRLPPVRARDAVHGNVFWTHGNSVFSARSFFQAGEVQPANENRYGFRLTAPLWSGAALSANVSQQRIRGQVNGNVLVPLAEERTPLAQDPATRVIVQRLLDAYPREAPNRTDIDPRALNTNAPQRVDTDSVNLRLDHSLGQQDRLGLGYTFTSQSVDAFQFVEGANPDTEIKNHRPRITWTRTWGPNTVSDLSVGFDRIGSVLQPEPNNFGPTVSVGNAISGIGPSPLIPVDRALNTFRYAGRVARQFSKHSLVAGFHLGRIQLNGVEQQAQRGNIGFTDNFGRDAITNLRLGTPTRLLRTVGEYHRGFRNWQTQFYLADQWKASGRLTLNLGLRYELASVPQEVNQFETLPYSCDCNNWSPRFGFAYRLGAGTGRAGTLRGAYAVSYGEIYPVTYSQFRLNAPNVVRLVLPRPNLADIISGRAIEGVQPGSRSTLFDVADDLVEPYVHQYNLSWETALAGNANLQLGYVGSRAHKVFQAWFLNRAARPEGVPVTIATLNARRPDSRYNDVLRLHNASRAYYDAARVSFILRDLRGLTVDASYWFSKSIDLGSDYTNTMNGGDARRAISQTQDNVFSDVKSLSFFDQPHAFLLRTVFETPKLNGLLGRLFTNWQVSAVTLLKSGTPFTVRAGSDGPGFGNVDGAQGDRPNLLDPSILGRTIGDPDTSARMLPRDAFAFITVQEEQGSLGLRTFRKGKIANVNASLSRSFPLASDSRLVFRAESVNFLNTPQFAEPNFNLTSPSFGRITNTLNDGRTFRFTLQLDF